MQDSHHAASRADHSAFWALIERIRGLDADKRRELSQRNLDTYKANADAIEQASARAWHTVRAIEGVDSTEMAAVAEAQDLIEGGEDLALAVLGADLIPREDYELLTAWADDVVAGRRE